MIRAVLKRGRIQPVDALPKHWREGQELFIESTEPSDDRAEIRAWYEKFRALSAQIPAADHRRLQAGLAEQDRHAKDWMRREMGLSR